MTQSNSNATAIEINGKIILHCDRKFGARPSFRPLNFNKGNSLTMPHSGASTDDTNTHSLILIWMNIE